MPNVVRCDACDRFYDGSVYDRCPYCSAEKPRVGMEIKEVTTSVTPSIPKEEEKKKPFLFGFFRKRQEEKSTEETKNEIEDSLKDYGQEKTFDSDKNDPEKSVFQTEEKQKNRDSRFENINENRIKRRGTVPMFAPNLFVEESEEEYEQDHDSKINTADIRMVGRFVPKTDLLGASEETESEEGNPGGLFISPETMYTDKSPKSDAHSAAGKNSDLMESVKAASLTKGIYISQGNTGESIVYPVVGWLVCVKGEEKGKSFNLRNGRNKIGRSELMDVKLLREATVSRTVQASIIYDSKERVFSIVPGESNGLCYVNGSALYERVVLQSYDEIQFGDTEENKYLFVAFCGEKFNWDKE